MKRFLASVILLLPLLPATAYATVARAETGSTSWKHSEFRIVRGTPGTRIKEASDAKTRKLEELAGNIASELAKQGFAEPSEKWTIVDENGALVRPIYIFSFKLHGNIYTWKKFFQTGKTYENPISQVAYFIGECQPEMSKDTGLGQNVMILNGDIIDDGGTEIFVRDFTHELMHAVQQTSDFRKGLSDPCDVGKWITEATADAVAYDLAQAIGYNLDEETGTSKKAGMRYYSERLYTRDGTDIETFPNGINPAYASSSFWRYLKVRALNPPRSDVKDNPRRSGDYSFLADMFNKVQIERMADREKREMRWLGRAISKSLKLGDAGAIYGEFITKHAAFTRWGKRNLEAKDAEKIVTGMLFKDGCRQVTLDADKTTVLGLTFERNSARCFFFTLPAIIRDQAANVSFSVTPNAYKPAEVGQFGIGSVIDTNGRNRGEPVYVRPRIAKFAEDEPEIALWTFAVDPKALSYSRYGYQLFVFSNFGEKPADTTDKTESFSVGVTNYRAELSLKNESSGRGEDPTFRKAGFLAKETEATSETLAFSAAAVSVRKPEAADCGGRALEYCDGIEIEMEPVPASPVLTGSVDIAEIAKSLADPARAAALARAASGSEGRQRIRIKIPPVDYGFTGRLEGAVLEVDADGRSLEAVGPKDVAAGAFKEFPPSAVITIDEYSPEVLRGSFEAELVDKDFSGTLTGEYPTLPVEGTIRGRFLKMAPWQGDVRYEAMPSSLEFTVDSVIGSMPLELRESVDRDNVLSQAGGGESTNISDCDCSCRGREILGQDPSCAAKCAESWNSCDTVGSGSKQSEKGLEARYLKALEKLYPKEMHEGLLEGFRQLSPKQRLEALKQTEEVVKMMNKP